MTNSAIRMRHCASRALPTIFRHEVAHFVCALQSEGLAFVQVENEVGIVNRKLPEPRVRKAVILGESPDASEKLSVADDPVVHNPDRSRKHPTHQARKSETSCFVTDLIECDTSDAMAKGDMRGRALYDRLMTFKPQGVDEYEWAKRAGLNRGYFNDIKEKNTSPRNDTLAKAMAVTGRTVADLFAIDAGAQPLVAKPPFNPNDLPRDVPIMGTATGAMLDIGDNGDATSVEEIELQDIIGYARRPPAIDSNRKAYALYIAGQSMEPRYRAGDLVYVDPRRSPMIGDDVIVQLVGEVREDADPAEIRHVLVKQLMRNSASHIELCQFNPHVTFKVPKTKIHAIHRVIPLSELLS